MKINVIRYINHFKNLSNIQLTSLHLVLMTSDKRASVVLNVSVNTFALTKRKQGKEDTERVIKTKSRKISK